LRSWSSPSESGTSATTAGRTSCAWVLFVRGQRRRRSLPSGTHSQQRCQAASHAAWVLSLFRFSDAGVGGVGMALHRVPSAMVARSAQLHEISHYDATGFGWRPLVHLLKEFAAGGASQSAADVDITFGGHFLWWLWLANAGDVKDVVDHGVFKIHVSTSGAEPTILVTKSSGAFRVFPSGATNRAYWKRSTRCGTAPQRAELEHLSVASCFSVPRLVVSLLLIMLWT
jgi:hypothetical protein